MSYRIPEREGSESAEHRGFPQWFLDVVVGFFFILNVSLREMCSEAAYR